MASSQSIQARAAQQETTVRERPILFSAPMVRAILDGRKTQTRRVVKMQPVSVVDDPESFERYPYSANGENTLLCGYDECPLGFRPTRWFTFDRHTNAKLEFARPAVNEKPTPAQLRNAMEWQSRSRGKQQWTESEVIGLCPYGKPGDHLWVRESSAYAEAENGNELRVYQADSAIADVYQLDAGPKSLNGFRDERWDSERNGRLRYTPSIHTPRWASRITLQITNIRVERLNDISVEDAFKEGIADADGKIGWAPSSAVAEFQKLWESINGADSWAANPWVWVVVFEHIAPV